MPRAARVVPHGFGFALLLFAASAALAQGPPPPLQPLPPPPQPAGNPVTTAKANLGKALFWDEQLSSTRTMACGSCHQAPTGGSDPRSRASALHSAHPGFDGTFGTADDAVGSPGVPLSNAAGTYEWSSAFGMNPQVTGRHAPSHINAAYVPQVFWDGRAQGTFLDPVTGATVLANGGALESQAVGPPVSSAEMGHVGRDWLDVAARVAASAPLAQAFSVPAALTAWIAGRTYPQLFAEAFGSADVTGARIAMAIASYERTQFSTQSPFDQLIAGNNTLTPQENAGFQLFGQLACAACHAGSLTSDNAFHYIGVRPAPEDSGRMAVTHNLADLGRMRTPILRNVALRPAFMHDGRFRTLEEVVDFYDRGGDFNAPNKDPRIVPLNLTAQQKAALVAFLGRPLTDPRVAAGSAPFDRPVLYAEEPGVVPHVTGAAIAGSGDFAPQVVALEPPLLGNPDFSVGLYGALGGAQAVLVLDEANAQNAGTLAGGAFARLTTTLEGAGAGQGYGSVTMALPSDANLAGQKIVGRWYVTDAGGPGGLAASEPFEFTLFGIGGAGVLAVGDGSMSSGLQLHTSQPNPFRANATLRFDLPRSRDVSLVIYDVAGRAVRHLVNARGLSAGPHSAIWNGEDDRGQASPGGVYFYRLESGGVSLTRRVIRLN